MHQRRLNLTMPSAGMVLTGISTTHVTDEPPGKNQHLRGVFRRRHTADEDSCSETRSAGGPLAGAEFAAAPPDGESPRLDPLLRHPRRATT